MSLFLERWHFNICIFCTLVSVQQIIYLLLLLLLIIVIYFYHNLQYSNLYLREQVAPICTFYQTNIFAYTAIHFKSLTKWPAIAYNLERLIVLDEIWSWMHNKVYVCHTSIFTWI